jgi:hypothetical protein
VPVTPPDSKARFARDLRVAIAGAMAGAPPVAGAFLLYYGKLYLGLMFLLSGTIFWASLISSLREHARRGPDDRQGNDQEPKG